MLAVNTHPWFKELLREHQPPCISVYAPLPRMASSANEASAHFRNTLDELRRMIGGKQGYGANRRQAALERIEGLMMNPDLWEGDRDALAFFVSPDHGHVIEIRRPVEPLTIVADSFHVKPLIRALQQSQRFQVLCVSPRRVRLFDGDPHSLTEVKLKNVPLSTDHPLAVEPNSTSTLMAGGGHKEDQSRATQKPINNIGTDRFFRMVDQAIWENYSRRAQVPMIVCADVQFLSEIIGMSKNDYVMKEGIALNPEAADPERLRQEAWRILEPQYQQQIATLKDAYHAAKARQLGSDEIPQVAEAAAVGRVGTLLVDSDAKVPGILHRASGLIEQAPLSNPRADDVLDDLAEMVLKMDGQVFVIPHDQMPTDQGVAAVYRY